MVPEDVCDHCHLLRAHGHPLCTTLRPEESQREYRHVPNAQETNKGTPRYIRMRGGWCHGGTAPWRATGKASQLALHPPLAHAHGLLHPPAAAPAAPPPAARRRAGRCLRLRRQNRHHHCRRRRHSEVWGRPSLPGTPSVAPTAAPSAPACSNRRRHRHCHGRDPYSCRPRAHHRRRRRQPPPLRSRRSRRLATPAGGGPAAWRQPPPTHCCRRRRQTRAGHAKRLGGPALAPSPALAPAP